MSDATTVYVLVWNSHSEYAEVKGAWPSLEGAMLAATPGRNGQPLLWEHCPADECGNDHDLWVAICGVVDQWEVYALGYTPTPTIEAEKEQRTIEVLRLELREANETIDAWNDDHGTRRRAWKQSGP